LLSDPLLLLKDLTNKAKISLFYDFVKDLLTNYFLVFEGIPPDQKKRTEQREKEKRKKEENKQQATSNKQTTNKQQTTNNNK